MGAAMNQEAKVKEKKEKLLAQQAAAQQEAMAEAEASVAELQIAMGSETAKVLAEMGQQKQLQEDAEDRLAAEIETVQLLEEDKLNLERDLLEQNSRMLAEKQHALEQQKEEIELEKRCVEATLDRTERAWHETLSREAELLQEAGRLKAVCHAKQEQCKQDMLLAEARIVASQVVGSAVARADQRGAAEMVRRVQAQHQCDEIEAMQRTVLATVQARHATDEFQDWSRLEVAVQDVVLESAAETAQSMQSAQRLWQSAAQAKGKHEARVEEISRRAALAAVEQFETEVEPETPVALQMSAVGSKLQLDCLHIQRGFAEARHKLSDVLAEGDVSLQQLVPLAMAGARPWLSMALVDFYRRLLALIGCMVARLDYKPLVAEALQVEAEAITVDTGCHEHDALLRNINTAMSLLAELCASKVEREQVEKDIGQERVTDFQRQLVQQHENLLEGNTLARQKAEEVESKRIAMERQLEQERAHVAQLEGSKALERLISEAQQDQWRETHEQELRQIGEQLRHSRVLGSGTLATAQATSRIAVASALGRDRTAVESSLMRTEASTQDTSRPNVVRRNTTPVSVLQGRVRSVLRGSLLKKPD